MADLHSDSLIPDTMPAATQRVAKSNIVLAVLKAVLLIGWIVIGAIVMALARLLNLSSWIAGFPLVFHGVVARFFFNMRCEFSGELHLDRPTMYVANHASYLDVFVLGGRIPGAFVAKSEVAGWPVFGKLAKLQNTMFLERKAQRAATQIVQVRDWLLEETNLILFPEGTSTSGDWVAPFRSSLFASAEGSRITVQPLTVVYRDYQGNPMSPADRDFYAWYLPDPKQAIPNAPFAKHFFTALGLGPSRVKVIFHPPMQVPAGDRKQAAQLCEDAVRQALEAELT